MYLEEGELLLAVKVANLIELGELLRALGDNEKKERKRNAAVRGEAHATSLREEEEEEELSSVAASARRTERGRGRGVEDRCIRHPPPNRRRDDDTRHTIVHALYVGLYQLVLRAIFSKYEDDSIQDISPTMMPAVTHLTSFCSTLACWKNVN